MHRKTNGVEQNGAETLESIEDLQTISSSRGKYRNKHRNFVVSNSLMDNKLYIRV